MKKSTFYQKHLMNFENHVAIIDQGNYSITHRELHQRVTHMANELKSKNLDFCIIHTKNDISFIISVLACWASDIIAVFTRFDFLKEEIYAIYKDLENSIIITDYLDIDNSYSYFFISENAEHIININNINVENKHKDIDENIAVLFPTSGFTASSKYANVSTKNILASIKMLHFNFNFDKNTTELVLASVVTVKFFAQVVPMLSEKGVLILCSDCSNIKNIAKINEQYSIKFVAVTPSFLKAILMYNPAVERLKKVENIIIGGEKSSAEFFNKVKKVFCNTRIMPGYGLTETLIPINDFTQINPPVGSVGRIYKAVSVKIINKLNDESAPNEEGEILLKGENIISGYFNNNELNSISWVDGWFKTGDLGFLDKEENLWITGRKKREIIVSGLNINAEEIEIQLNNHDSILAAYVYSKNDKSTGERICVNIVLNSNSFISEDDVLMYLNKKVSRTKIPKEIYFVPKEEINFIGFGKVKFKEGCAEYEK